MNRSHRLLRARMTKLYDGRVASLLPLSFSFADDENLTKGLNIDSNCPLTMRLKVGLSLLSCPASSDRLS